MYFFLVTSYNLCTVTFLLSMASCTVRNQTLQTHECAVPAYLCFTCGSDLNGIEPVSNWCSFSKKLARVRPNFPPLKPRHSVSLFEFLITWHRASFKLVFIFKDTNASVPLVETIA